MDNELIDYGRVPAGTTRLHNGCDRSTTFKLGHKEVDRIVKNDINCDNTELKKDLEMAFSNLKLKFPTIAIAPGHRENIVKGCMILCKAYQTVHTPHASVTAFRICGQHCEPDMVTGSTICFERMMAQCYTDIPMPQLELMKNLGPQLVEEHVMVTDRVPFKVLVDAGITAGRTSIDRDDMAMVSHSAEIISHESTFERFAEWKRTHTPECL